MGVGLIRNVCLVLPEEAMFPGELLVKDRKIIAPGPEYANCSLDWMEDFNGDIVIPGLIDTHVHGAGGWDVMDGVPESLAGMGRELLQLGTTGFLATTMAARLAELRQLISGTLGQKEELLRQPGLSELLGMHLEGPFLSPQYCGAQAAQALEAGEEAVRELGQLFREWHGVVRILTLAPELPLADRLIELCLKHQVIPSAGHSGASLEEMTRAEGWGLVHVTHAYNAMAGLHHRHPGLLARALLAPWIMLELIADGIHVHPQILELTLRLKGAGQVCLISDGIRAVGMPDGEYKLGSQTVYTARGQARLADGTLAGSAEPLLTGVVNLVKTLQVPLPQAVNYASLNPAKLLGVDNRLGSLETGKDATFLRLNQELELKQVWQRGRLVVNKQTCP